MISLPSFIKFFLAILLASGSSALPIIGDVGSLVGEGVAGSVIGFLILLVFYWFVVGKVMEFLVFALGGGIGRYSTTKLYRRLQLLTFVLFIALFVWPFVVLGITASPVAEPSPDYVRAEARILAQRRSDAVATRQASYEQALVERNAQIEAARWKRNLDIQIARNDRERRIKEERSRIRAALVAERDAKLAGLGAELRAAERQLDRLEPQFDFNESETIFKGKALLQRTFDDFDEQFRAYGDAFSVRFDTTVRRDTLSEITGENRVSHFNRHYLNSSCRPLMEDEQYALAREADDYPVCLLYFVLINYDVNAIGNFNAVSYRGIVASPTTTVDMDAHFGPRIRAFSQYLNAVLRVSDQILGNTEAITITEQDYERRIEGIDYTEPEIDPSAFPLVDESDYPIRELTSFPLIVDQSPLGIEDNYFEQIEPTFLKHFWWMYLVALVAWLIFQEAAKPWISGTYARIMRFLDEGRFGFGGSARFASMFEEWRKPYQTGRLFMGRSLYNPFDEIGLDGETHMITVAGSRGGKGATAIIPNLLLWEGSCVVVDPKGTNAHVTAEARRKMGQKVYLIDPFNMVTQTSDRFDPFEGLDTDDNLVRERIASIADALVIHDENSKDPHWDEGAQTIISGLISHVVSGAAGGERWLYAVRDLIRRLPEEQDRMWAEMAFNEEAGGYAKDAATRYIRGSETNEILGLMSNADKHTEWLSSPVMREITSNPTFRLSDLKKEPTTVYLIIPPRHLERQKRLVRLFVNLMLDAMENGGRSKVPVLMIIDEFLALDRMPEIPTAFATMASYNLVIWLFVQELKGLQNKYKDEFEAFIANSRAMQVFATTDKVTKDYISERLGNRPMNGLAGIAKSNDNVPLRSPVDIEKDLKASEQRQYIIEAGNPPMIIEKVPYFKGRRFARKHAVDPDFKR